MRNRWLVNLLLLILVMVLGALMRRELESEQRVERLTGFLPEGIDEILLERPDEPVVRLTRGAAGWRMSSPYEVPAHAERIGQLVRIASTRVYRSLPKGTDLGRLGLDPGRNGDGLRLVLNGLVMRFGAVDPIAQLRYVAIGEQVHLIADGFYHHLIAPAAAYVDRKLLPEDFKAAAGSLDGMPLSPGELAGLQDLAAESIEPLGTEWTGRLLSLRSEDEQDSLRFLVSADGRAWSRVDLRLRYLVTDPPAWAIAGVAPDVEAAGSQAADPE